MQEEVIMLPTNECLLGVLLVVCLNSLVLCRAFGSLLIQPVQSTGLKLLVNFGTSEGGDQLACCGVIVVTFGLSLVLWSTAQTSCVSQEEAVLRSAALDRTV